MKPTNHTDVSEFLLLGLTEDPELHPVLFGLFLSMYMVTILGNLLIILAVGSDPNLHTPMYFFLSHLSFTDICISTTTIPKMLVNIKIHNQHISYTGCLFQMGLVIGFGGFESCLLAAMAYDRYVAICHPLMYTVIMNPQLCVLLILLSLLIGMGNALLHSLMVLRLSFCRDLEVPHFFCDLAQVIKLACSDTLINNILIYFMASLFGFINTMEPKNHTEVPDFLLLGLTEDPELQPFVYSLFLSMYLVSVLGNLLIILAIGSDAHVHTPMYLFLSHLSFNDICLNTTMIPKMLVNIQAQNQHHVYRLSHPGWLFMVFVVFENCLLAAMAYDRYVAICHPLMYTVILTPGPVSC
ncbi:Olfactory Receptor 7G1 [Manis pentadactyla]|nr:Olfactory Receptor 7G1 [Manis pentadactyla]